MNEFGTNLETNFREFRTNFETNFSERIFKETGEKKRERRNGREETREKKRERRNERIVCNQDKI